MANPRHRSRGRVLADSLDGNAMNDPPPTTPSKLKPRRQGNESGLPRLFWVAVFSIAVILVLRRPGNNEQALSPTRIHPNRVNENDLNSPPAVATLSSPSVWVDDTVTPAEGWWERRTGGDPPFRFPAPARMVVIGDVHGDLSALRRALRVARAVDDQGRWIGEDLVVVQMGDNLDRGTDELAVIQVLQRLKLEAEAKGGTVHALLGNHEMQNVAGDFASVAGSRGFDTLPVNQSDGTPRATGLERRPSTMSGFENLSIRAKALAPGGVLSAGILSERNVASIFGKTLVVHGGVLPQHATRLERINSLTRRWLRGNTSAEDEREILPLLFAPDSVLWARVYSQEVDSLRCAELTETLASIGVSRMVVGHTPQLNGITTACGGAVWRVDTGMAAWFAPFTAREVQVLEITMGNGVRVLREQHGLHSGDE